MFVGSIPICTKATTFPDALNTRLIFSVRVCAIFSDLVVLCCTWYFAGIVLDSREFRRKFVKLILQQGVTITSYLLADVDMSYAGTIYSLPYQVLAGTQRCSNCD